MGASLKTRYVAEQSLVEFFRRRSVVFYWTFTFAENEEDKEVAEARLKPLRDLIKRRGGEELHFWERQERGAWHVHLVTNVYLDVTWLRPWMVARGWGPIMRVERVRGDRSETLHAHASDRGVHGRSREGLIRYLLKYLTKSLGEGHSWEKNFGGSASAKAGTTTFKWVPWIRAGSMLYAAGAILFFQLEGRAPTFHDIGYCIRLGYEETGWANVDPWYFDTC